MFAQLLRWMPLLGLLVLPPMAMSQERRGHEYVLHAPAISARLRFEVDSEGAVSSVVATYNNSEAVRTTIEKAARGWRFAPVRWQGKAVTASFDRYVQADLVPTTTGGHVLRFAGFTGAIYPGKEFVPPAILRYEGFRSDVLYAFDVAVAEDGRLSDPRPIWPQRHPGQQSRKYAEQIAGLFPAWRVMPINADGTPVACRRVYLEHHPADRSGYSPRIPYRGWLDELEPDSLPPEHQAAFASLVALAESMPDLCPLPRRLTPIVGVMP